MQGEERPWRRIDPAGEGAARHGIAAPRGQSAPPGSRGGRFARMFPSLPPCDARPDTIEALVERLRRSTGGSVQNRRIPAGYTYLGQFVDHDITFDPTSKLQRDNDPQALVNFRSPRFDLDSLYGSGPADQPFLYDWSCRSQPGVKLLVGCNPRDLCLARVDLPRNEQGRALIGDARNDENLVVSQLHLLFIHFHNKVVDTLLAQKRRLTCTQLFEQAQRLVRWHYQWIVTHDFLERIVGKTAARSALPPFVPQAGVAAPSAEHGQQHSRDTRVLPVGWRDEPVMPVEFSAAAFRFGHTMVRADYVLNSHCQAAAPILPARGHEHERHLGGFRRLPASLEIDWRLFFGPRPRMLSMHMDHVLAPPLFCLPPDEAALPRLNLLRGRALGLPSGADVARAVGQPRLTDDELLPPDFWPPDEESEERDALLRSTPLWFYLLREADVRDSLGRRRGHLGPVGGAIVAAVLVGLLEGDPQSYLRAWPPWAPTLDAAKPGDFTMPDLLAFTKPPSAAGLPDAEGREPRA